MANAGFTNEQILNSIRDSASQNYQDGIPVATANNQSEIGNLLLADNNIPSRNEFLDMLVNKFAKVKIASSRADNRLARFYRGAVPFGMTIQEIFVNQARNTVDDESRVIDFEGDGQGLFDEHLAEVKALYYEINRSKQYCTTITRSMLKAAFANEGGLNNLINEIVNSLYVGNEQHEFEKGKETLSHYAGDGETIQGYATESVAKISAGDTRDAKRDKAEQIIETIRGKVLDLTFNSDKYNGAKIQTLNKMEDLVLFLHKDLAKYVDVYVKANAYNLDRIDWLSNVIYLDDFGDNPLMADCVAILADEEFLNIYDYERTTTTFFNPKSLKTNTYYTVRQGYYCSPFKQAVAFIADDSIVTA